MDHNRKRVILIKGRTRDGRTFRPSDWAQRLALAASAGTCPTDRPMCFHRSVHIGDAEGLPVVVVDADLQTEDPGLFEFLMAFARMHDLECTEGPLPEGGAGESRRTGDARH